MFNITYHKSDGQMSSLTGKQLSDIMSHAITRMEWFIFDDNNHDIKIRYKRFLYEKSILFKYLRIIIANILGTKECVLSIKNYDTYYINGTKSVEFSTCISVDNKEIFIGPLCAKEDEFQMTVKGKDIIIDLVDLPPQ